MIEKRDAQRLKIGACIRFRIDRDVDYANGLVVDISRSGILLESERRLKIGDSIAAEIEEDHDGAILRFNGVIVRVEEGGACNSRYGCRFNFSGGRDR